MRLDLPGALCSFVRAYPGCKYAEVLRTSHLADACIVAVVEDQAALTRLITALPSQRFTLDRLVLQCPPLETEAGTLDDVLGSEPETG